MSEIEKTVIAGLLNNEDFCKKVIPFIQEEYFLDRCDRCVFCGIKKFIEEYNAIPSKEALRIFVEGDKTLSDEEVNTCNKIIDSATKTSNQDETWLLSITEKFCKDKAIYNAILESIHIIDGKDKTQTVNVLPEILSKALGVSFQTNIGHDLLENHEERYEFLHRVEDRIPFDLEMFNVITKGGITRKTLSIILAGTGVGKSAFMCHHAAACLMQNKNVLYITLEMAEERIAERIDANIMDITLEDLASLPLSMYKKRLESYTRGVSGKLIVKEYPTSVANVSHFRVLLDELKLKKSFIPDILFVDYLNICSSSRLKVSNNVNSYTYIKAIAEELRGLAMERNIPVISATQVNRAGFSSSDVELTDTSECIFTEETVTLVDGSSKKIGDVIVGDQITSNDGYKTVMMVHHKKTKPCVKITLESGKTIIVSKDHVFPIKSPTGVVQRIGVKTGLLVGDKLSTKSDVDG